MAADRERRRPARGASKPHKCDRCSRYPHATRHVDGEKISALRLARRWTQTRLATLVGVSPQYMCQIERGHRPTVAPDTFGRIMDALGVRCPSDLLASADTPPAAPPQRTSPVRLADVA